MTSTGNYAEVNGLNLYYEIHGTGFPMVVLPGGILNIDSSFGKLIPTLAKSHMVIAIEPQGHGRTADIERAPEIDLLADDVVELLRQLGIDRADFFGFSLGGLISLSTVVRHPNLARNLIVAAAHIRASGYHDELISSEKYPESTRMPTQADFEDMQAQFKRTAPDPDNFFPFLEKMNVALTGFHFWTDDEIAGIQAPTLIVIGDHDFVRIGHAEEMHELIPNSRLAVLPGTTHMGIVSRMDWIGLFIEDFFASTE